jgi:hypothetical protein
MKTWLIPISLAVLGSTARADQCEWLDDATAQKAKDVLVKSPKHLAFCEPCGDQAPGVPQRATSVEITAAEGDHAMVVVDGAPIDLAYVFVRTDDHHYRNLAALAGCPTTGVSPSLSIEAETPSGVMIRAGTDVLPPAPPPPPPPVVAVAPPAPAPAPQVYVYTSTTREIAWLPILLATAGGFLSGVSTTLVVIAMRRRRAMRPRAVELS